MVTRYVGRFAPSPTGPLHAGSLVAALASWLDARAHAGQWLVRIEDADTSRCVADMDRVILQQLAACGLHPDEPPVLQSQRTGLYQQALDQLAAHGLAYPCGCSRKDIDAALSHMGQQRARHSELVYPGTCRTGLHGCNRQAWRLRTDKLISNGSLAQVEYAHDATNLVTKNIIHWTDRRLGPQQQDVLTQVGDYVLKRFDGCFSYQLAVVVDDAAQGVTDVVRGEDLADNTPRQILLQRALGLPTPRYLHTPLVLGGDDEKLSKQNGAMALDTSDVLSALNAAAALLGLPAQSGTVAQALERWVLVWGALFARTAA
ncbi:MAG: tRNA glutamyl-Q(34) synthetase GluQRS [Gammaproteobacteria bacterium]|uniref:tRNA glutamyl-Q(34) synthetase GluQRS n=1 Tax=Rhodoferax sp. TaxID=50421 RepID=UPI001816A3FB|nr:tRNA glutamyl-Q(34) synthetase GluQRS [Rhodoferax sp.]MBU3898953.1 tRNA glutamyl-Q(34) synthetase GluQRS [Gammaproteobacteria bacterium]MBA3059300.1 tRNA glutamyl-Q(34) synthetase GluQRS [Rhodoferax sp.]MBU3997498.1 tRNA glutamyl-Q(34) synthetase GluQRS [Gammaproteobacteria bacterium]MBU4018396.1 tRNA glutamyl-Q(34) synthetase GluQRS [Gammaproteobacteria bacterium]MBU4080408.1 tRNA glutamyl-Q(34) synthetase GluQRS [Gammaproteobacteria bacterium]